MRLVLTTWPRHRNGVEPSTPTTERIDLADHRHRFLLVVMLGNGEFDEVLVQADSADAVDAMRGLLTGTGGASLTPVGEDDAASPAFRPGHALYKQLDAGRFFIDPDPRPELFAA